MKDSSMVQLQIQVHENDADAERTEQLTRSLIRQLRELDVEYLERIAGEKVQGTKGNTLTIGALILGIAPVTIPALITFVQNWVGSNRKVALVTPNGAKIEFTADRHYSGDELVELIQKINQIPEVS
ncbi:MAG: hypothetical protein D3914_06190 [Candidatus Electrothrix sp. LOE2]|nr:hypothetical protein [Candidatus Electrothrix sp. LOE2]